MVQQFREREVQQSGQVSGYQNVTYSPDAFGASIGRAITSLGGNISEMGATLVQLDKEKKQNDVFDTINKAKDALRPVLFDPDDGIFARQGQNAMDADKSLNVALNNIQTTLIDQETDPQKRELLKKLWTREVESAKDSTAQHQLKELGNYKKDVTKAAMFGAMEDAYNSFNNEKTIQAAIDRANAAIEVNSEGLPTEALEQMKRESLSNIRLAAISRWSAEDPAKALDYYKEHKNDLTGKDHVTATQFIKAVRARQNGLTYGAQIVNGGNPWLFQQIEKAESNGNTNAESVKNAVGVMQVIPSTAREVLSKMGMTDQAKLPEKDLKELMKTDTELNRRVGQYYLNEQLQRFGGDVEAALVAYNAGPAAAEAFLNHNAGVAPGQRDYNVPGYKGIKSETEVYVQKILGALPSKTTPPGQRMTKENWTLKNFKPSDLMAPTEGGQWVDARAATQLDALADRMKQRFRGFSIKINEDPDPNGVTAGRRRGTSDPKDNPHVSKSQHLVGTAFDVQVQNWTTEQKAAFIAEARALGFKGFGFYGPRGHLHIDMGKERTWGSVPSWAVESLKTPVGNVPGMDFDAAQQRPDATTYPGGNDSSGYFIDSRTSAKDAWLAQAATIQDPTEREIATQYITKQAALMDQQQKEMIAATKQDAWNQVIAGKDPDTFTPELLSRLDPAFVATLNSYYEDKAKGGPLTDWNVYTRAKSMPVEELLRTDIMTEFRPKLADEQYKEIVNIYSEALKKADGKEHDAAKLGNARTFAQIVADNAAIAGWKDGSAQRAQFSQALDGRIQAEQQLRKETLTSTEIQDIADKLLIEDKFSSANPFSPSYYTNQGRAIEATNPDEFVAASNWSEVQADDQKTLIENYSRMLSGEPNQEEAVDIYNRAMRVWLGGKADGPPEEMEMVKQQLQILGIANPTDKEIEQAHGRYLLTFLGRYGSYGR